MSLNDNDNLCQIQQKLQLPFQPEKKLKIRSLYRLSIKRKAFSSRNTHFKGWILKFVTLTTITFYCLEIFFIKSIQNTIL